MKAARCFNLRPRALRLSCTPFPSLPGLYTFPSPDVALVQGSDGNFYGATLYGGAYDEGYFFQLILL